MGFLPSHRSGEAAGTVMRPQKRIQMPPVNENEDFTVRGMPPATLRLNHLVVIGWLKASLLALASNLGILIWSQS